MLVEIRGQACHLEHKLSVNAYGLCHFLASSPTSVPVAQGSVLFQVVCESCAYTVTGQVCIQRETQER